MVLAIELKSLLYHFTECQFCTTDCKLKEMQQKEIPLQLDLLVIRQLPEKTIP